MKKHGLIAVVFGALLMSFAVYAKEQKILLERNALIFQKLRQAVQSGAVPAEYAIGAELTERSIALAIKYPRMDVVIPELTAIAQEIIAALPREVNIMIPHEEVFTWATFRERMIDVIMAKDALDRKHKAKSEWWKTRSDEEGWRRDLTIDKVDLFPAFITAKKGLLGNAVLLIAGAFNVGLYGVPTDLDGIFVDGHLEDSTAGFVGHDHAHMRMFYSLSEGKYDLIRSGALRNLLVLLPFTEEIIDWLIYDFRESEGFFSVKLPKTNRNAVASFYRHCLDRHTTLGEEEIIEAFYSFNFHHIPYRNYPHIFKHVKTIKEGERLLKGLIAPHTPLLKKMQDFGFIVNRDYTSYFMNLVATLEAGGQALLEKVEIMKDALFSDVKITENADHLYIELTVKNLRDSYELVQRALEINADISRAHSFQARSDLLRVTMLKIKRVST